MSGIFDEASCASLPPDALSGLASVRTYPGIRVKLSAGRLWLWWQAGDELVLSRVLPLPDVKIFARRDGTWFRAGHRLPTSEVADDEGARALSSVLLPAPVAPQETTRQSERMRLTVVRDSQPRLATALLCKSSELAQWAESATSHQIELLQAARCNDLVLVRGQRLPAIREGRRWWGDAVLTPLGFRPEPNLSDGILCQALGIVAGDVGLLTEDGCEVVPGASFRPMSRASIRLAARV